MSADLTTLVMLPGLDGTGLVFEPLRTYLPAGVSMQVVPYPVDQIMSFQEHVEFARKQIPTDRPFVLLAESFSGPVALQMLITPPEQLLGVIFVASFVRYPVPFLLDVGRHFPQTLLLRLFTRSIFTRLFCLGGAPHEAVKLFRQALLKVKLPVLSHRLQLLSELPPPPQISFSRPSLYLQASRDWLVPRRAVRSFRELFPQLHVQKITGPHIILLARPEAGAKLIIDFISSLHKPHS
ncbi:MAG: alpha/beta fold hydrolase [Desulfuromonadales bacterium]